MRRLQVVKLNDPHAEQRHVQPNGVDLSLDAVWRFSGRGALGVNNADRSLPAPAELTFAADGWLELAPATYGIRYAEWVEMPVDCGGLCFPRSSLPPLGGHVTTPPPGAGQARRGAGGVVGRAPPRAGGRPEPRGPHPQRFRLSE